MSSEETDANTSGTDPDGYDLSGTLPIADAFVPRGTNLLVSAPSMLGTDRIVVELLGEAPTYGENSLVVTTNDSASRLLSTYRRLCPSDDLSHLYIVDASGVNAGGLEALPATHRETVTSPGDLTGIGIAVTKCARTMGSDDAFRLGFVSVSTLLQYVELERAFSFLHVITGRLSTGSDLGLFTVDPTMHDERTVNTITSLFDGVVELRERDDAREVRLRGVESVPSSWHPYPREE